MLTAIPVMVTVDYRLCSICFSSVLTVLIAILITVSLDFTFSVHDLSSYGLV
jgi:hypothetical protein